MLWEFRGIHLPLKSSRQNLRRRSQKNGGSFLCAIVRAGTGRPIPIRLCFHGWTQVRKGGSPIHIAKASGQLAKLHILEGDLVAFGFEAYVTFVDPYGCGVHVLAVH